MQLPNLSFVSIEDKQQKVNNIHGFSGYKFLEIIMLSDFIH